MKKRLLIGLVGGLFLLGMGGNVFAVSLTVDYAAGTTYTTSGLSTSATSGSMMDGMLVTLGFGNGTTTTKAWSTGGSGSGAFWSNFSLTQNGNTFGANWSFDTDKRWIDYILIDAGAGDAVFDVVDDLSAAVSTDGSARGHAFSLSSATGGYDIVATYSDLVALDGFAAVGDLYRTLLIDFVGDPGVFKKTDTLSFLADTDSLKVSGDLQPVPEPATILLLGAGLVGLGFCRRKKNS